MSFFNFSAAITNVVPSQSKATTTRNRLFGSVLNSATLQSQIFSGRPGLYAAKPSSANIVPSLLTPLATPKATTKKPTTKKPTTKKPTTPKPTPKATTPKPTTPKPTTPKATTPKPTTPKPTTPKPTTPKPTTPKPTTPKPTTTPTPTPSTTPTPTITLAQLVTQLRADGFTLEAFNPLYPNYYSVTEIPVLSNTISLRSNLTIGSGEGLNFSSVSYMGQGVNIVITNNSTLTILQASGYSNGYGGFEPGLYVEYSTITINAGSSLRLRNETNATFTSTSQKIDGSQNVLTNNGTFHLETPFNNDSFGTFTNNGTFTTNSLTAALSQSTTSSSFNFSPPRPVSSNPITAFCWLSCSSSPITLPFNFKTDFILYFTGPGNGTCTLEYYDNPSQPAISSVEVSTTPSPSTLKTKVVADILKAVFPCS